VKDLLEKKFDRVELPKRFLPVNIHGEGKGETSVPWSSDVSDDASEAMVLVSFGMWTDFRGDRTLFKSIQWSAFHSIVIKGFEYTRNQSESEYWR
jgi:hypothetical protein